MSYSFWLKVVSFPYVIWFISYSYEIFLVMFPQNTYNSPIVCYSLIEYVQPPPTNPVAPQYVRERGLVAPRPLPRPRKLGCAWRNPLRETFEGESAFLFLGVEFPPK